MSFRDWKKCKLDDLIEKRNQGVNTTTEKVKYSEKGIPVIRAQNVTSSGLNFDDIVYVSPDTFARVREECKPKKNDVLYTNIGSQFGTACVVDVNYPFLIAWNVLRIQVKKETNPFFLKYVLNNPKIKSMVRGMNSSSTMPFVSGKEIGNIDFLVPKLSIQTNIASMLSAFDEKIELIRQINQTLEAMAQAIYKEWLVNFNFPGATGEMQDSEFGPIPRGWRVAPIKDLVEILSGFAFKGGSFIEDGRYKIITIKNVQDGIFDSAKTSRIDVIPDRMPEYCKLKEGDILLSLTGNVGRVCFVYGQDMLLNQRVAKLLPKDQSHFGYMYTYFRSDPIKNDLISLGKGTAQQNLSPIETQNKLMIIPSRDMLLKFGGIVNPLYEMFIRNLVESRYLIEARDHLLPKFMNGEIEV